jgi:Sec-independent protein secretion pathway component TatC
MERANVKAKNFRVGLILAAIVLLYIGALVAYMVVR